MDEIFVNALIDLGVCFVALSSLAIALTSVLLDKATEK